MVCFLQLLIDNFNFLEHVHSQGKVLGDRSVLYKYDNPNLVAIMSVDSPHTVLSINLVDAASGAIVYTAKHERASEPVNLLHCENWVVVNFKCLSVFKLSVLVFLLERESASNRGGRH